MLWTLGSIILELPQLIFGDGRTKRRSGMLITASIVTIIITIILVSC